MLRFRRREPEVALEKLALNQSQKLKRRRPIR